MTQQSETLVLSLINTTALEIARISDRSIPSIGKAVKGLAELLNAKCEEYFLNLDDNGESYVDCTVKFDLLGGIIEQTAALVETLGESDDAEALQCALTFIGGIDLDEAGFLTLKQ